MSKESGGRDISDLIREFISDEPVISVLLALILLVFLYSVLASIIEALGLQLVPVVTLLGVLLAVIISGFSLRLQYQATARESLEQLDDLQLGDRGPDSSMHEVSEHPWTKIKPILHRYRWPIQQSEVKLQVYNSRGVPGVSQILDRSPDVPEAAFEGYDVIEVADGYIVHLTTTDSVEIRRRVMEIFQNISRQIE